MLETTITRANPLVDPALHVWSWEIPVYLFAGGVVAGMMILGGVAMLRVARGEDPRTFFSLHTPLLAFLLINLGMGALFLDLAHKLYVWRVYLTLQPSSPMSWGSWVLIVVYAVLLASALIRLPEAWPWLGRRVPALQRISDSLVGSGGAMRALGWANVVLGVALGIYTGILLNTMVARPLWNTAILGPLFLISGLSAGAAAMHVASAFLPLQPAPSGPLDGALSALVQRLGPEAPARRTVDALIRADIAFLAIELVLLGLLIVNLQTSSASHAAAAALIVSGPYAWAFWAVVVALGIIAPMAMQGAELGHVVPHTVVPAVLVLVGGFVLRWVVVSAGQASHVVRAAGL